MYRVFAIICTVCCIIGLIGSFVYDTTGARIVWAIAVGLWIYNLTQMD